MSSAVAGWDRRGHGRGLRPGRHDLAQQAVHPRCVAGRGLRGDQRKLYVVGGDDGEGTSGLHHVYTPGDIWLTKAASPTAREDFAAAVIGGKVFALGGLVDGTPIAVSHSYDPGTSRWTSRAAMPSPWAGSNGAAVINGIVYVPGGYGSSLLRTNKLFAYNAGTNTWSSKAGMPKAIGCGGSGAIGGKLWVYGTCKDDGSLEGGLYRYDPATNAWGTRIASPVQKFPAVGVVNGKLYLAGGLSEGGAIGGDLRVYDPGTGQWTSLQPMKVARHGATAVVLNGWIYIAGGRDGSLAPVNAVEAYNPSTGQWRTVTGMPTARSSAGAGVSNGRIYVVGGRGQLSLPTAEVYVP